MGPPSDWSALPPEPIRVAIVGTFYTLAQNTVNAVVC